jgi:hypothetical protein
VDGFRLHAGGFGHALGGAAGGQTRFGSDPLLTLADAAEKMED